MEGGGSGDWGGGGRGIYPPIIGPLPPNNYKMHTPNIFNLPNLLNGDLEMVYLCIYVL